MDGAHLQTYDFYPSLSTTIDMEEDIFQNLLAKKLTYIRKMQMDKKVQIMNRNL